GIQPSRSERNQTRFASSQPNDGSFGPNPPTSLTHASSCSASSTCVLPVSAFTLTSQRSLLSCARTLATATVPSGETCGILQRTSRWPANDASAASLLQVSRFITASVRLSCVSPTNARAGTSSV